MNTAIGYVRRSKKSDDKTISIEEQTAKIHDYCSSHNLTLATVITHDGVSGTKRNRFNEIENAIVSHGAKELLVYHRDRLARDVAGLMDLLRDLDRRDIRIREVTTGSLLTIARSQDFLVTGISSIFDEYFPRLVSEKTTAALSRLRAQGKRYSNDAPFGFAYLDNCLVEDPAEQRALIIISACRDRRFGARRTKKALIEAGYTGRMGLSTIHRALQLAPPTDADKLPAQYFALGS